MIQARKEQLIKPELHTYVFHELIYGGKQIMKVVGIRAKEIELEGDYSGGTNPDFGYGSSWFPIDGAFYLRKICVEQLNPKGCQLHNLHCSYPDCEPYLNNWGHYVEGKLVDVVEIIETT